MERSLEEAKSALAKAKDDMAQYYNQRHILALEYQFGDRVFLDASNIKTTHLSPKLTHEYLGLYAIQWKVGQNAY
jgi:hypothetical protein